MVFSAGGCLMYWMFSVWEGLHGVQCRWMLNVEVLSIWDASQLSAQVLRVYVVNCACRYIMDKRASALSCSALFSGHAAAP